MKWMLALDITEAHPEHVVEEAARWAQRAGATLDLVHVEGARYAYEFITDPYVRDLMAAEAAKMRTEDQKKLNELLERLPSELRGQARLLPGRPVPVITDEAKGYDAVLIGTHGRKGLAHFWLGSVAEQVVRRCNAPVLVLRVQG